MNYAVAVLIISPEGIPLIRDPKKPMPIFWKVPGGRSNSNESAKAAVLREVKEETGIKLSEKDLSLVYKEDRESHVLALFSAEIDSLAGLKKQGNEGEEIKVFSPKQVLGLRDFFPNHRKAFGKILGDLSA